MEQSEAEFKPVMREYRGSYLHLNFDQLRINLASLVNQRHRHFTRLPDYVDWRTRGRDGERSGREPVDKAAELVGKCDDQTSQFQIKIFHLELTPRHGLELPAGEYVFIGLDFDRKTIVVYVSVAESQHAHALFRLAVAGMELTITA